MTLKVSAPDGVKVRWWPRCCVGARSTPAHGGAAALSAPRSHPSTHTSTPPHKLLQVYHITGSKTEPQWLSEGKRASLRKNDAYRRRLELLQDFDFPAGCTRIRATPDQQYLFATGYHPPMVRWLLRAVCCAC